MNAPTSSIFKILSFSMLFYPFTRRIISCRSQELERKYFVSLLIFFVCQLTLAQAESHFYGTIGNFKIEMELTNQDGSVSGWYWYPGKSEKLGLVGVITSDRQLRLKETNPDGKLTGLFNGSFDSDYISKGIWQSADLKKEFVFELKLDNNISLITGERITPNDPESFKRTAKGRLYEESRVEGFSKLALIVVIMLFLGLTSVAYLMLNYRKKHNSKTSVKEVHTREKEVHFVNESMDSSLDLNVDKGDLFQRCVVKMFDNKKEYFEWLDAAPDVKYDELYPKSNMNPDLIIRFKNENQGWREEIAVECKYRAGHQDNLVFIDEERKLNNYRKFSKTRQIRTFLVLGVGGTPDAPKSIFVIPIDEVGMSMKVDDLQRYRNKRDYFYFDYYEKTLK